MIVKTVLCIESVIINQKSAIDIMIPNQLKEKRKELFDEMEQHWNESNTPEDDLFYHHSSEDRIVLSHAIFWVMTKAFPGNISKEKFFLLLRQYQEEMLDAYLTDSDDFPELLRYCNIMYNTLPSILRGIASFRNDRSARRLAAISVVAGGYGGDMPESQFEELLDDMDFYHNRVKCGKIERLVPTLNKLVEEELRLMP